MITMDTTIRRRHVLPTLMLSAAMLVGACSVDTGVDSRASSPTQDQTTANSASNSATETGAGAGSSDTDVADTTQSSDTRGALPASAGPEQLAAWIDNNYATGSEVAVCVAEIALETSTADRITEALLTNEPRQTVNGLIELLTACQEGNAVSLDDIPIVALDTPLSAEQAEVRDWLIDGGNSPTYAVCAAIELTGVLSPSEIYAFDEAESLPPEMEDLARVTRTRCETGVIGLATASGAPASDYASLPSHPRSTVAGEVERSSVGVSDPWLAYSVEIPQGAAAEVETTYEVYIDNSGNQGLVVRISSRDSLSSLEAAQSSASGRYSTAGGTDEARSEERNGEIWSFATDTSADGIVKNVVVHRQIALDAANILQCSAHVEQFDGIADPVAIEQMLTAICESMTGEVLPFLS